MSIEQQYNVPDGWVLVCLPMVDAEVAAERLDISGRTDVATARMAREHADRIDWDPDEMEQDAIRLRSVGLQLLAAVTKAKAAAPAPVEYETENRGGGAFELVPEAPAPAPAGLKVGDRVHWIGQPETGRWIGTVLTLEGASSVVAWDDDPSNPESLVRSITLEPWDDTRGAPAPAPAGFGPGDRVHHVSFEWCKEWTGTVVSGEVGKDGKLRVDWDDGIPTNVPPSALEPAPDLGDPS